MALFRPKNRIQESSLGDRIPDARPGNAVLGLQPGEWVRVRSAEEIRSTLDAKDRIRRTKFMDGMWKHCGREYEVLRRVEKIVDYRTGAMWRVRNTVILKGVYCEQDPTEYAHCDQTCFYYWKEAWLTRLEGAQPSVRPGDPGTRRDAPPSPATG